MKFVQLFLALKQGSALAHASTWKNISVATALLTSVLSAFVTFAVTSGWIPPHTLDNETITAISGTIVSIVTFLLSYLGIATDENMGV